MIVCLRYASQLCAVREAVEENHELTSVIGNSRDSVTVGGIRIPTEGSMEGV